MVQARADLEKRQQNVTAPSTPQYSTSQYSGYSSTSSATEAETVSTDAEEEEDSTAEAAIA